MCKNANNPCPGCKKHTASEAAWMFFTDEERQAPETTGRLKAPAAVDTRR